MALIIKDVIQNILPLCGKDISKSTKDDIEEAILDIEGKIELTLHGVVIGIKQSEI